MKVVLFCGGEGMRMREFSGTVPKPMVPVGYRPILWHSMRYYAHYGHRDFIICLGHRGDVIKGYFMEYKEWLSNDFIFAEGGMQIQMLRRDIDDWRITFVETGKTANVGQRLMAVRQHLEDEDVFLANYADVLTDAPLPALIDHFRQHGKVGSFLAARPSQTFHVVTIGDQGAVNDIQLASKAGIWVNGGFFVLRKDIFDFMQPGDDLVDQPFQRLIQRGELTAYRHDGFWVGMDTFKERQQLDEMFTNGKAPWAVWDRQMRGGSPADLRASPPKPEMQPGAGPELTVATAGQRRA